MGKRIFDIFFALILLFLSLPFFLLSVILVKISSRGPVFYAHQRVGRGGRLFGCYKFRTMFLDADARLKPLLASNPLFEKEWGTYFKLKEDPRITSIGRILRKTSLDELPQIFNVLKGEMSIVGPRPLTQHEVDHYLKDKKHLVLSLRPGLTTLWVTRGRNALSLERRIELEEEYVKQRTLWLDLKLIFQTFCIMIFPKGAY